MTPESVCSLVSSDPYAWLGITGVPLPQTLHVSTTADVVSTAKARQALSRSWRILHVYSNQDLVGDLGAHFKMHCGCPWTPFGFFD